MCSYWFHFLKNQGLWDMSNLWDAHYCLSSNSRFAKFLWSGLILLRSGTAGNGRISHLWFLQASRQLQSIEYASKFRQSWIEFTEFSGVENAPTSRLSALIPIFSNLVSNFLWCTVSNAFTRDPNHNELVFSRFCAYVGAAPYHVDLLQWKPNCYGARSFLCSR